MQLQIGNTIKHLRKERDITQEQFAEILGVSCQSVSRWENNTCYPDIELLPVIASFFDITIDGLLGYDQTAEKQTKLIEEFALKMQTVTPDVIGEIRDAIQTYPKNISLQLILVTALYNRHVNLEAEEKQIVLEEIVTLCRKILKIRTDEYDPIFSDENTLSLLQNGTKNILIPALVELKRYEEAHEVALLMPVITSTREFTTPMTLKGISKKEFLLNNLPVLLMLTMKIYISGIIHSDIESDPTSLNPFQYTLADYKREIHLIETVYEMFGDCTDINHELCSNIAYMIWNHHAAKLSAEEGDFDAALHHLKKTVDWLIYPDSKRRNVPLMQAFPGIFLHDAPGKLSENGKGKSPAYIFLHGYVDAGYFAKLETAPENIRKEYRALIEKIRLHIGEEEY